MKETQNHKRKVQDGAKTDGVYVITKAFLETAEQWRLHAQIVSMRERGLDFMPFVRLLNSFCRTEKFIIPNLVPTVAREMIANNLSEAVPTNAMKVKFFTVGSDGTAPANSDVKLGTETFRNAIASLTNAANVMFATGFIAAGENDGTYAEVGIWSDGSLAADSGILDSHALISVTQGLTETLTVDFTFTIT